MQTKRACLVKPGQFELFDLDLEPKDDEVMIKVASCGLCNWELNFWKGYLNFYGYPHKLGHEAAGTVVKVGKDVKNFKVGDNVSGFQRGFGGYATYNVYNQNNVQKLAPGIDPKYALGEPQKCIVTVLRCAHPEAGDYGVIVGLGSMGLWCTMALKGNLLAGLIAIDVDDAKLEMAKKFGATYTINSQKEDAVKRLAEITNGHLADFVIEGTGIPAVLNEAQKYVKSSGKGRLILMSSHEQPAKDFDFRIAVSKALDIIVAHPGHSVDELDDFRRAVNYINSGVFQVKPLISNEYKLSDINHAFQDLEHKPAGYIKGIVIPDEEFYK